MGHGNFFFHMLTCEDMFTHWCQMYELALLMYVCCLLDDVPMVVAVVMVALIFQETQEAAGLSFRMLV